MDEKAQQMFKRLCNRIVNREFDEDDIYEFYIFIRSYLKRFKGKYKCPFCGQDRRWIPGTNVMVCVNESCKGFKAKDKKKEGEEIVYPSFKILSTRGEAIADSLMG